MSSKDEYKKVENKKWKILQVGKTIRAFCLVDGIAKATAPECATSFGQKLPSGGHYNLGFFNCFWKKTLGPQWDRAWTKDHHNPPGTNIAAVKAAFGTAFAACPAAQR